MFSFLREGVNEVAELVSAVGVTGEHIEGGGAWAEENGVTGLSELAGEVEGVFKGATGMKDGQVMVPKGGDLIGHFTENHDCLAAFGDEGGERGIVEAFVLATRDENDWPSLGKEGLFDGVGVGAFGVVDVIDALIIADEFAAVGKSDVGGEWGDHLGKGQAMNPADGECGHEIFRVVDALQLGVRKGENGLVSEENGLGAEFEVSTCGVGAEGEFLGFDVGEMVAEIDHRPVVRRLIFEDADFCLEVGIDRGIAIEVIGGES